MLDFFHHIPHQSVHGCGLPAAYGAARLRGFPTDGVKNVITTALDCFVDGRNSLLQSLAGLRISSGAQCTLEIRSLPVEPPGIVLEPLPNLILGTIRLRGNPLGVPPLKSDIAAP